jgi:hypothetical protein
MLLEPVLVGLDRQCPHQPQAALAIGEDAHDMGASPDLFVESRSSMLVDLRCLWCGRGSR